MTVVELADRLLSRAVSPQLQEHLRERHESSAVRILTGTGVEAIEGAGRVERIVTDRGVLAADLVVYGIGATPRDELARDEEAYFRKLLGFYGITTELKAVAKKKGTHFRSGDNHEWRSAVSEKQAERMADMMSDRLCRFYGFER